MAYAQNSNKFLPQRRKERKSRTSSYTEFYLGTAKFLGVGLFALPAGILGSGFIEEIQKKKKIRKTCPHCGKELY